jgi:predicted ArsR family transcriptional regulator
VVDDDHLAAGARRLAVLSDAVRRALYRSIVRQDEPVGRDAAAKAVGVNRRLAAFHLDKLADAGLLTTSYRRLTGREGPGAGRPAKLYSRAADEITVSVPPRDYELAARVFTSAIATIGDAATTAVTESAHGIGAELAAELADQERTSLDEQINCAAKLLDRLGYQPYHDTERELRLRNCPFHRLAERHREVVCTANLHLIRGALERLRANHLAAELSPTATRCCVQITAQPLGGC